MNTNKYVRATEEIANPFFVKQNYVLHFLYLWSRQYFHHNVTTGREQRNFKKTGAFCFDEIN